MAHINIFKRVLALIPALILQIAWYVILYRWLSPYSAIITLLVSIFSIIFVLYIISARNESTYKTLWIFIILGFPIVGTVLYMMIGNKRASHSLQWRLNNAKLSPLNVPDYAEEIEDKRIAKSISYLQKITTYPLRPNESAKYYALGDDMFIDMLEDMKQAKKYIFLEYFIITPGYMWDSMVSIMKEKVKEGVDVRVMFDDIGSVSTFSKEDMKALHRDGIQCIEFNPLIYIKGTLNYRDHRKMLIVDSQIAYSGGINLADEYINKIERFGHWKDIGFRITGQPVLNYLHMFTHFWNAYSKDQIPNEYAEIQLPYQTKDGYILSYYDTPLNDDAESNELYVDLLYQAKHYAYFFTPYLMLGDSLLNAMCQAALRGIDVRIIMPGIPDKKLIFRMSRSYYYDLLKAGVKIYEYTPGFVHAKSTIFDDQIGTVGTVNLDYRSLFLHFENNSLFYQSSILKDMKKDFLETQEKCKEIKLSSSDERLWKRLYEGVLRIFAPLC